MENKIIDTHAHLTCEDLYPRINGVIDDARAAGIDKMICVCCLPEEYQRALSINDDNIYPAYGIHPEYADEVSDKWRQELEEAAAEMKLIAIGEIGLDYHWVKDNADKQKELFVWQLKLAEKYQLPVLIHMRDATKDTLDILREYCKVPFIMHCFSGSKETAAEVLHMGGYISFAGPITFKNAKGLLDIPKLVPKDRMFVETDCPYMTPVPFRGKQNESKYVSYTFAKVCELLSMDKDEMAKQMQDNFKHLFKI